MSRIARVQVLTVMVAAVTGTAGCAAVQSGRAAPAASVSQVPTSALGTPTYAATPQAGTPTAAPPTPRATAPSGPSAVRETLLTQADSGRTILLPVGTEVTVVLTIAPGIMMWEQPVVQGSAVTRVSASGGYPSGVPARAVFRAVAPGTADLGSATDAKCNHQATPCPVPDQAWQVTVLVPAS